MDVIILSRNRAQSSLSEREGAKLVDEMRPAKKRGTGWARSDTPGQDSGGASRDYVMFASAVSVYSHSRFAQKINPCRKLAAQNDFNALHDHESPTPSILPTLRAGPRSHGNPPPTELT